MASLPSDNLQPGVIIEKTESEIALGLIACPFSSPLFLGLHFSPAGLVPKKEFRFIQHLSHPVSLSINDGISVFDTSVQYQSLDDTIQLIRSFGENALLAKSDIESAFCIIPIIPSDYPLLGFKATNLVYYMTRYYPWIVLYLAVCLKN